MTIHFLGSKLSVAMLELSIELSLSTLVEAHTHCIKLLSDVYVKQCLEALAYMFVMSLTFTKFIHIILVQWRIISIAHIMTHKPHVSNIQKSMENMHIWCTLVSS